MSNERTQKTFTLSFNSKINSELKTLEALQKLPKGYGKKLFLNLLEEKFGKSSSTDFAIKVMHYLDLETDNEIKIEKKESAKTILNKKVEVTEKVEAEKSVYKSTSDSLEF